MAEHMTYGAAFADVYDEWYGQTDDLVLVTALLGEHSPRHVLELGVGTGRVALAMAEIVVSAGGQVVGVDESPEMLSLLASKDPRGLVTLVRGDMANDQPSGEFDLVFISYNTLFNLSDTTQQATCIENAASRLSPSGRLIIDACIIHPDAPTHGTTSEQRGDWHVHTTSSFDAVTGIVQGSTVSTHNDGRRVLRPWRIAYQSPASIDALCARAGLSLLARHASWHKTPFADGAARHVSVFGNLR